ncbi:MAG: hypothetical protein RIS45_1654, partial [Planctomycetota bacterium]
MPIAESGSETAHRRAPAWHGALAPFEPASGVALRESVLGDLESALRDAGEFPSPGRYAGFVDPAHDSALALEIVVRAFELAPRAADELAAAWKRAYPSWAPVIDRARAAASLLEELDEELDEETNGPEPARELACAIERVGPSLPDGSARYELLERIGSGSGGTVFRALDHALSRCGAPVDVAVKLIGCSLDEVDLRLREAGAARAVSHAAIARVLDAGVAPESVARRVVGSPTAVFIVSEFIAGVPLYVWKAMHPARAGDDCARMAQAVADALDHCHAQGVAHGDLSPANVLVDDCGNARVVDFGMATWIASSAERSPLPDQAERDMRRVAEVMRWLVRGLSDGRNVRRATDDIERRCAGRRARRRIKLRDAAVLAAAGVSIAVVVAAYELNAPRGTDPVTALFGESLADRPDLADLARDLLDDGRPTLWPPDVFTAKVRALREEATFARRRGAPSHELEL